MAITGMHALIYSKKADETRRFLKDVLGLRFVDAGHGWLIFAAPPAELAVHPVEDGAHHELYLMCDDIDATIADLKAKGAAAGPITEQPWGRLTQVLLPGGETIGMYQPKHPTAIAPPQ